MRKRIGLITISPEEEYQQRIMKGIFKRCAEYDYDVVVISSLVQISHYFKDYLSGELNIYDLINFDIFDGIIVTPIPMTEDRVDSLVNYLLDRIRTDCKVPVVSAGVAFGDYKVIATDDKVGFYNITKHMIEKHNCKDIAVLTGMKDYDLSYLRVDGVRQAMSESGLTLSKDRVYFGDFWYTSGKNLADDIISGAITRPDVVICGNDAMAIGLVNHLIEEGIKVPEDIKVTGYDARSTAALNNPPISSYEPEDSRNGELCVDYLRQQIEPTAEIFELDGDFSDNFKMGETCGCEEDHSYTRARVVDSLYLLNHDYDVLANGHGIDVGSMMESYTSEILTNTTTPEQCVQKIYESKYLLEPYGHFYMCLNPDWLDIEVIRKKGYPEKMNLIMQADMKNYKHGYDYHVFVREDNTISFDTKKMLPALYEETDKPQVYYFAPLHFQDKALGYVVLQNNLTSKNTIGLVFRNYIRNINNALEMSRVKNRITNLSVHDVMTGLLNRRGMQLRLEQMEATSDDNAVYMCFVVDMDGLKVLNDTYGHVAGDQGIMIVSNACQSVTGQGEICVRAGGDEFFIIGVGAFDEKAAKEKLKNFNARIEELNAQSDLPVKVSASIGYSISKGISPEEFKKTMEVADEEMYRVKCARKALKN